MSVLNYEPWIPSVDVCGFCGDCYCDGIACIAALDPDNQDDHPQIEHLQLLVRAGKAMLVAHDLMVAAGYARGLPTAEPPASYPSVTNGTEPA